jgi:Flp pilus assembly pilin Flp
MLTSIWARVLTRCLPDERGQATVEYFLVILAATALAILAFRWFQSGPGSGLLSSLFSKVISWVTGRF